MNKKIILTSVTALTVGGLLLGGGAIALSSVSAEQNNSNTTVFEKVISALGLNTTADKLQVAFQTAEQQARTETATAELSTAVTGGKLTQTQSDLAQKIETWLAANRETYMPKPTQSSTTSRPTQSEMENMRTQMETKRTEMMNAMFSALGITQADYDSLQTALQTAGVRMGIGMGRGGDMMGGKGGRMGRGDFKGNSTDAKPTTSTGTVSQ